MPLKGAKVKEVARLDPGATCPPHCAAPHLALDPLPAFQPTPLDGSVTRLAVD